MSSPEIESSVHSDSVKINSDDSCGHEIEYEEEMEGAEAPTSGFSVSNAHGDFDADENFGPRHLDPIADEAFITAYEIEWNVGG